LDVVDQRAEQLFLCGGVAPVDGFGDADADRVDVALGRAGVGHVDVGVQVGAALAQACGSVGSSTFAGCRVDGHLAWVRPPTAAKVPSAR